MDDTVHYIPIEKELIPYSFNIKLADRTHTFLIRYNGEYDFFTIDLLRGGELIVAGEKIVYGRVLFDTQQYRDIPVIPILPCDLSGTETRVSWDNLNRTVFLWLIDEPEVYHG